MIFVKDATEYTNESGLIGIDESTGNITLFPIDIYNEFGEDAINYPFELQLECYDAENNIIAYAEATIIMAEKSVYSLDPDEYTMLVGSTLVFGSVTVYMLDEKHPYGEYVEMPVRDVECKEGEDKVSVYYYGSSGNVSSVSVKEAGTFPVEIQVPYGTESLYFDATFNVVSCMAGVEIELPNNGGISLLPQSEITLTPKLIETWTDGHEIWEEEIKDFQISIDTVFPYDTEVITAEVNSDQDRITIYAHEKCNDEEVHIKVLYSNHDGAPTWVEGRIPVSVVNSYYSIPDFDYDSEIFVGESCEIAPKLKKISRQGAEVVSEEVTEGLFYALSFDEDYLSITDKNGTTINDGTSLSYDFFPLKIVKNMNRNATLSLEAYVKEESEESSTKVCAKDIVFNEAELDIYIDGLTGKDYLEISSDGNKTLTIAGDTIAQDTNNEISYQWMGVILQGEDFLGYITDGIEADGKTVTLNGAMIKEKLDQYDEDCQALIGCVVTKKIGEDNVQLANPFAYINVIESELRFDINTDKRYVFPGDSIFQSKDVSVFVRNSEYPEGRTISGTVTDCNITNMSGSEEDFSVEERDDGYNISCNDSGTATILLEISDESGEVIGSANIDIEAAGIIPVINYTYPKCVNYMLKGSTMTVTPEVAVQKKTLEGIATYSVDYTFDFAYDDDDNPLYDDDLADITIIDDGKAFYVEAKYTSGELRVPVRVTTSQHGVEIGSFDSCFYVNVVDDYYYLDCDYESDLAFGETATIEPELYHVYYGNDSSVIDENISENTSKAGSYSYRLEFPEGSFKSYYDEDGEQKELGTGSVLLNVPVYIERRTLDRSYVQIIVSKFNEEDKTVREVYRQDLNFDQIEAGISFEGLTEDNRLQLLPISEKTVSATVTGLTVDDSMSLSWRMFELDDEGKNASEVDCFDIDEAGNIVISGANLPDNNYRVECELVQDNTVILTNSFDVNVEYTELNLYNNRGSDNNHWIYTDESENQIAFGADGTLVNWNNSQIKLSLVNNDDEVIYDFSDSNYLWRGYGAQCIPIYISGSEIYTALVNNNMEENLDCKLKLEIYVEPKYSVYNRGIFAAYNCVYIELREPKMEAISPLERTNYCIGESIPTPNYIDVYVENADYPNGEWLSLPISNYIIKDDDIISQDWFGALTAAAKGTTTITFYYTDDNEEVEYSYSTELSVNAKAYRANIIFPETENMIIAGSYTVIGSTATVRYQDNKGEIKEEAVDNYHLEIDEDNTDLDMVSCEVLEDGKGVIVNALAASGNPKVTINAIFEEDGKVVETLTYTQTLEILDEYYLITDADIDPKLTYKGEQIIAPTLKRYYSDPENTGETTSEEITEDIKFVVAFDSNDISVYDKEGNEIEGESVFAPGTSLTIKRNTLNNCSLDVKAYITEGEELVHCIAVKHCQLDYLSYSLDLDGMPENNILFTGKDYTFTPKSEIFSQYPSDNITVKYYVFDDNSGDEITDYYTVNENGSITIATDSMYEDYRSNNIGLNVEVIYSDGENDINLIEGTGAFGFYIEKSIEGEYSTFSEITDIPGYKYRIDKLDSVYVRNDEHPDGAEVPLTITAVVSEGDENAVIITEEEDEFVVTFNQPGSTKLIYYYTVSGEEKQASTDVYVVEEYIDTLFDTDDGEYEIMYGTDKEIKCTVRHYWNYDGVSGRKHSEELSDYSIKFRVFDNETYTYSEELYSEYNCDDYSISVTEDGNIKVVSNDGGESYCDAYIQIVVTATLDAGTENERELTDEEYLALYITEAYCYVDMGEVDRSSRIGETQTISPKCMSCTDEGDYEYEAASYYTIYAEGFRVYDEEGNEIEYDTHISSGKSVTIERISAMEAYISCDFYENIEGDDYCIACREVDFNDLSDEVSFTGLTDSSNRTLTLDSDSEATVSASTDCISPDVSGETDYIWKVSLVDKNKEIIKEIVTGYEVNEDDSITLDGEELASIVTDTENTSIIVSVSVTYDNEEITSSDFEVKVNKKQQQPAPKLAGICQMPCPWAEGALIGFEPTVGAGDGYYGEILILDCTLLAQGKDAWFYTTGPCGFDENGLWTIVPLQYGYYWTLYRIYDKNGNLVDEQCYGFENI